MPHPVVLVPGLDGTGLLFYRQVPSLERRFSVATHRLRDDASSLRDLVEDLHAHVEEAGHGGPVTLIGESFGGALSLSYSLAHPERVARMVVVNAFPYYPQQARLRLGYHLLRVSPWAVMGPFRRLTARHIHSPGTTAAEIARVHDLMRQTTRRGYLSRMRMLRDYDVRPRLPELAMPVLYLASDRDRVVPAVEQARLMSSLTANGSMQVLERQGHVCLITPDVDLGVILEKWIDDAR